MSDLPGSNNDLNESESHDESGEEIDHIGHTGESLDQIRESIEKTAHDAEETLKETIKKSEEKENKVLRSIKIEAFLIPIITVIGVALSIGVSSYWNEQQHESSRLYSEANEIKEQINTLLLTRNSLMDAMIQVRAVRFFGQRYCKNNKYVGNDPLGYQEKLYSADFKLANAIYNSTGILTKNVKQAILRFTDVADSSKVGICEESAPTDITLRTFQTTINNSILDEISLLKLRRDSILSKAQK